MLTQVKSRTFSLYYRITPTDDDNNDTHIASVVPAHQTPQSGSGLPPSRGPQITMRMPALNPNSPSFTPQGQSATGGTGSLQQQSTSTTSQARVGINVRPDINPIPTYGDPTKTAMYVIYNF